MADLAATISVCSAALFVGAAVGATGVGGVLLVPALWALGGMPMREAMGTVLTASAANGALATLLFARRGAVDWRLALPLSAGGLVFAFAGGELGARLPAAALVKLLGVVIGLGCAYAFLTPLSHRSDSPSKRRAFLVFAVGLASGLAAGVTGAGGPLVSVPLMTALGFPFLGTVAASQVLQLVASASAATAYWRQGAVSFSFLAVIVPLQLAGIWAGVKLAHRIDVRFARRLLAVLGVLVGGLLLVL
ncbi:MAG TPA: sulfite exporter TauE/SafE family protein [Burkholderiales bacterium]|jgi:uncharacterized membrane protein YfcA|nr:sulfite exporter TauE/SafE family protein [Burkholderiales bacterium]